MVFVADMLKHAQGNDAAIKRRQMHYTRPAPTS
jgi:hypothetical protein